MISYACVCCGIINDRCLACSVETSMFCQCFVNRILFCCRYEDQREQFDEFCKYSKEVEQELELELKQKESQNKELKTSLNRYLAENESLRVRFSLHTILSN